MIPQRRQQTAPADMWEAERKTRPGAHAAFNVTGHLSLDFKQDSIEKKIH